MSDHDRRVASHRQYCQHRQHGDLAGRSLVQLPHQRVVAPAARRPGRDLHTRRRRDLGPGTRRRTDQRRRRAVGNRNDHRGHRPRRGAAAQAEAGVRRRNRPSPVRRAPGRTATRGWGRPADRHLAVRWCRGRGPVAGPGVQPAQLPVRSERLRQDVRTRGDPRAADAGYRPADGRARPECRLRPAGRGQVGRPCSRRRSDRGHGRSHPAAGQRGRRSAPAPVRHHAAAGPGRGAPARPAGRPGRVQPVHADGRGQRRGRHRHPGGAAGRRHSGRAGPGAADREPGAARLGGLGG